MRWRSLVAVLLGTAQALAWEAAGPAYAQDFWQPASPAPPFGAVAGTEPKAAHARTDA